MLRNLFQGVTMLRNIFQRNIFGRFQKKLGGQHPPEWHAKSAFKLTLLFIFNTGLEGSVCPEYPSGPESVINGNGIGVIFRESEIVGGTKIVTHGEVIAVVKEYKEDTTISP